MNAFSTDLRNFILASGAGEALTTFNSEQLQTFAGDELRRFGGTSNGSLASAFGVRIFNYRIEQSYANIFPNCVFDIDLPMPSNVMEEQTYTANLWTTNISIVIATQNPDTTMDLADQMRDLLHEYQGNIGDYSIDRILIQSHSKIYELEPEIFASQLDFKMNSWNKPQFTTN